MGDAGGAGGNNMNIKQAKNEVKNTVKAYLSKDAHGARHRLWSRLQESAK